MSIFTTKEEKMIQRMKKSYLGTNDLQHMYDLNELEAKIFLRKIKHTYELKEDTRVQSWDKESVSCFRIVCDENREQVEQEYSRIHGILVGM